MRPSMFLALSCLLMLGACEAEKKPVESELEDIIVAWFDEGWNQGNTDVFEDTIAENVVFTHGTDSDTLSREQMSDIVLQWREAFPGLHMAVEDILVDGDRAAVRITFTGTHEGEWAGAEPLGQDIHTALMVIFRFEEGRMVELWEISDQLNFQRQLGLLPDGD
ncbi:ester cyclase [Natronospira bacteriovora]|uniref:Ester cyclase n=1 Tax=Natronospira bacteriovora TaxID=3069753 RepID=A0ABU0W3L8_9GAMM|nr:ester cyclase [Natronospira sp. AB-CW4]MDQ2068615.1 ester cyclase [Natronospira sp. AB-CW4]